MLPLFEVGLLNIFESSAVTFTSSHIFIFTYVDFFVFYIKQMLKDKHLARLHLIEILNL